MHAQNMSIKNREQRKLVCFHLQSYEHSHESIWKYTYITTEVTLAF